MEQIEKLLEYTDEIWKLAFSKCGNAEDADDLVQDTYLAALTALTNGKIIEYPRTWLANTLMHIWNSRLRAKYRTPVIVTMDDSLISEVTEEEPDEEEQVNLRNRIASLTKLYREVIVMHYIGGLSVAEIAERLDVPEGTVKRRLHDGREKMKKEKVTSREAGEFTPMQVSLSWNGSIISTEIFNFAEKRLVQEMLACAYRKPVTLEDMSEEIGIPVYYLEDLADEAVEREIMILDVGKYITDAQLDCPEDAEAREVRAEMLAKERREVFIKLHETVEVMVNETVTAEMSDRARMKMHRFFFIETLQLITRLYISKHNKEYPRPKRKNGGNWILLGAMWPLGYEWELKYSLGGHRNTGRDNYTLHEFDTTFYDSRRWFDFEWIDKISCLMYSVYAGEDPIKNGVPAEMIEKMDYFRDCGLFTEENKLDIPVISEEELILMEDKCLREAEKTMLLLEDDLTAWQKALKSSVPAHIPDYTAAQADDRAFAGFELAVCWDLYEQGVHLVGVDFCFPPVVLSVR